MPTKGQIQAFERVHKRLQRSSSKTQQREFEKAPSTLAFKIIERLHVEAQVFEVFNFIPKKGEATPKQLRRYAKKRHEAGKPLTLDDAIWAKSLSSIDINQETVNVMVEHQRHLDDLGVTPSPWRQEHGFIDHDRLREGKRAAAQRRVAREEQAAVDRRLRGIGKPPRPEKQHPYDRATRGH